jgi:RAB protein geranylgeranyltransferase component A
LRWCLKEELEQVAIIIDRVRLSRTTGVYLAVLIAALVIVAVGTAIWLLTDNNAGTNSLASDQKAMTRTP